MADHCLVVTPGQRLVSQDAELFTLGYSLEMAEHVVVALAGNCQGILDAEHFEKVQLYLGNGLEMTISDWIDSQ